MSAAAAFAIALQSGVPPLLWGMPGIGKTSFTNAVGKALGLHVETVITSIREPSDFGGLPIIGRGANGAPTLEYAPPDWGVILANLKAGILFFDECSCAAPATQSAMLRVVLEKRVGPLQLPMTILIGASANPTESAAGGWDLAAPLANRFCHLDWAVDPEAWIDGTLSGWPTPRVPRLPDTWQMHIPHALSLVASYIRHRPDKLAQLPKDEAQAGRAWPSPRSWTMAGTLIAACQALGEEGKPHLVPLVSGCVGGGHGIEFHTWLKALDLPDPKALLANPSSLKVPSNRGDMLFAILNSVVAYVLSNPSEKLWQQGFEVLGVAVDQGAPDIAAAVGRTLAGNKRPEWKAPVAAGKLLAIMKEAGLLDRA